MKISKADLKSTPEEAGYSSERLDVLDNYYVDLIEQGVLQGAVYGMARNNKVVTIRGMGKKRHDEEQSDTVSFDSIRRIASMTKLFTSVAVMKLVEDGKIISLNSKLAEYIKEFDFKGPSDITLKHLLTHTSGLHPDGGAYFEREPVSAWDILYLKSKDNPEYNWIQAAAAGQMHFKPGERWAYCSVGMGLLGEIITRVTGVHCEDWIMDNIVKPLGMTDTYFDVPEEKWDRVITVNNWSDPYKVAQWRKKEAEENKKNNRAIIEPRTGNGLWSTALDILKFGQMLCNNGEYNGTRILSRRSVEMFRTDCGFKAIDYCWTANGSKKYYGCGCELYGLNRPELLHSPGTYGHEGAGWCALYIDPEENYVMMFFIPNNPGWHEDIMFKTVNIAWSGLL